MQDGDEATGCTGIADAAVRGRPGVTSVIVGPRTEGQLEENLVGFRLGLPDELAGRLDDISQTRPQR